MDCVYLVIDEVVYQLKADGKMTQAVLTEFSFTFEHQVEEVQTRPGEMARFALIRATLQTAETSQL